MAQGSGSALDRWREELEAWAIPEEIMERAPQSPWGFPVGMFRAKADQARRGEPTPSNREALRFLGEGGTVLDVGAGAGAASLPLAGSAGGIMAVDESEGMIEAFLAAATTVGVEAVAVVGRWPDVAAEVDPADVVVCNDVLYNVQDLGPFALALTDHARLRVVAQITQAHPLAPMGPLWRHFHGLERPAGRPRTTPSPRWPPWGSAWSARTGAPPAPAASSARAISSPICAGASACPPTATPRSPRRWSPWPPTRPRAGASAPCTARWSLSWAGTAT